MFYWKLRFSILTFKGLIGDNNMSDCNFISSIVMVLSILNTNVRTKVTRMTFIEIIAYLIPTS